MTNPSEIRSAVKIVKVRAYDARVIAPEDLDDVVLPIFAAQNSLWNELVQTEHAVRARVQLTLESARPEIQSLRVRIEQLQSISSRDDSISRQLATLRRSLKSETSAARRSAASSLLAIEEQRKSLVKEVVKRTKLWWCHSESVSARYEKARLKAIKEGRSLKFHKFTGHDTLRLRLGHGGLPIRDIYAGKTTMLRIDTPSEDELGRRLLRKEDGGMRAAMTLRIGAKEGTLVPTTRLLVTIQQGHEPPSDIPLKMVSLRREVSLSRVHWKISLTFSGEQEPTAASGPEVSEATIEIGFGSVTGSTTRGLTVAILAATHIPTQTFTLPAEWIERMRKIHALMSELDAQSSHSWLLLSKKCAYQHEAEEWFLKLTKRMLGARIPKHGALIAFAEAHMRAGSPFGYSVAQELQQLAEQIKRSGQPIYDMRKRAIEHRNTVYRNFAATIARSTDALQVVYLQDQMNVHIKQLDGRERAEFREISQFAAISILKKFVEQACLREGVRLDK